MTMGEFHEAVTTLLQAFASGISIIRTQRGRRKQDKISLDPARKEAESVLSRSLKRNRRQVKSAYEKDVKTYGAGFRAGDEEARSKLATILLRLNAGFVSIIERFTRGKSSTADYQSLLSLSNTSRLEAMRTFEQLSGRMSQSSMALVSTHASQTHRKRKRSSKKGSGSAKSRSTSELANTPLGFANTDGWVRPKQGRKMSSESTKTTKSSDSRRAPLKATSQAANVPRCLPAPLSTSPSAKATSAQPTHSLASPGGKTVATSAYQQRTTNRKSIISFASDSTKLGEIPEHRWARPGMLEISTETGEVKYPVTAFYPIEPYQEPEKRSRLRRLFGRT